MENHDYAEIVGSANAPFFNSLIAKYGLATNYMDSLVHPSLPNYLFMISGGTQGVTSDFNPTSNGFPKNVQHLGSQLIAKSIPWRSYQESMGTPCKLTGSGAYAPKHDPFLYFTDIQNGAGNLCANTNVDYSQFQADLTANTNRFYFITPNLTNDGHDPGSNPVLGLQNSDAWAKIELGKIMASQAYLDGGVIFLTWDEAEGRNGDSKDKIPMIVISELIVSAGFKSNKAYSHKSYLATVEDILATGRLATTTGEPNMMEFFK
jgi:acid phosphatase